MPSAALEPKSDVGKQLLEDLAAWGEAVNIRAECTCFRQSWDGVIEAVKPAGGFGNVMKPDLHLHLKFVVASRWKEVDGSHCAMDTQDQPPGSSIGAA